MRIKAFHWVIEDNHLREHTLNNSTVVVDGQNFFYQTYRNSGLQYVFGCESDRYATYLRRQLSIFKKANVKCYFIFKGGHKDMERKLTKSFQLQGRDFILGEETHDIVIPIFMKDVCKQILDEMGFNYAICEFEATTECIALAQKLKCPIISRSIDFAFSGQPYIPYTKLAFNEPNNALTCGVFSLDRFLQKYYLDFERLAVFVALTDTDTFPGDHFMPFIKTLSIPLGSYRRNICLLQWLGTTTRDLAVQQIFNHINLEDTEEFLSAERNAYNQFRRIETPGIPSQYLENGNKIYFVGKDPFWFEKGVASKHIPIPLINISQAGIAVGSWAIADNDAEDAMLFAMDIIKYAYNLLTNFQKKELTLYSNGKSIILPVTDSVTKPDYDAAHTVFENGWECLPKGLFEHFLVEAIHGFVPEELEMLPEDCRMLMIALIYFTKRKSVDVSNEALCFLLSYVTLNILSISDKNKNTNQSNSAKPFKCQFDANSINEEAKKKAREILNEYFVEVNVEAAKEIFNPKWIHPMVEFEHCLEFLNHLNTLCGCPYKTTVFSKTFNGTFVYKLLWTVKAKWDGDGELFIDHLLGSATSVLKFLADMFEFMKNM